MEAERKRQGKCAVESEVQPQSEQRARNGSLRKKLKLKFFAHDSRCLSSLWAQFSKAAS